MAGVGTSYPSDYTALYSGPSFAATTGRTALSAAMAGATAARPLGGVSGVRPGTPTTIASATSTTWTVTPFGGYIDAQTLATNGGYFFSFQNTSTGTVTAAAGSARVDLLFVQTADTGVDGTTVAPRSILDIQTGVAGAGIPALTAARAFVIAQINVPASGGGSPTVTWVAPNTVAAGGILPVPNTAAQPATGYVGQQVDNAANGGPVRWNGTAWRGVSGSVPIIPTSAVGGTVTPGGSVTFSGASAVSLNGCFTTEFDNYLISLTLATVSADGDIFLRVRSGGTDLSTATYMSAAYGMASTTPVYAYSNPGNNMTTARATTANGAGSEIKLFSPALLRATHLTCVAVDGLVGRQAWGSVLNSLSYDGFTLTGAGTLTGTIRVDGLSNGN